MRSINSQKTQHLLLFAFLLICSTGVYAQKPLPYKTMSVEDVMKAYNEKQDFIFLDVRTEGEYHDTSRWSSANIGRIKGAINIPVQELDKHINDIKQYKDRNIIVYCSHSYRSRKASTMLVDSGFKHVYNMNSGLTGFYTLDTKAGELAPGMIESRVKYASISAGTLYNILRTNKKVNFIEIIPESYQRWDSLNLPLYNILGSFGSSRKYTYTQLTENIAKLQGIKNEVIVVCSRLSLPGTKAAAYLSDNGFTSVNCLHNGLFSWYYFTSEKGIAAVNKAIRPYTFTDNNKFDLISVKKACNMLSDDPKAIVLDIRSAKAFNDTTEGQVYSYTHLTNAVHIPAAEIKDRLPALKKYIGVDIIIVDEEDVAPNISTVAFLAGNGFKVHYMPGGLVHWEWFNNNEISFTCGNMLNLFSKTK